MKMLLICSAMVLGLGCERGGVFGNQTHIQGSVKTDKGQVDFEIAIDKNGSKIFFEHVPYNLNESSDDHGNPLGSKDEEQKD